MGDVAFGIRLRMAREKAGLKQQEVCDKLGVLKVQTLSAYERGVNNPPIDILKELALQYGVSTDSLLFGSDGVAPQKRTTEEYLRLLVESAVHLGLEFVRQEDAYGLNVKYFLSLTNLPYEDFDRFVDGWAKLEALRENETITPEEYEMVLGQRLAALKIKPVETK